MAADVREPAPVRRARHRRVDLHLARDRKPLPTGLSMSPEGAHQRHADRPVANQTVTVQVTDAFTRTAPATNSPGPSCRRLTIAKPADQISTLGKTDTLALMTTGGNGTGYTTPQPVCRPAWLVGQHRSPATPTALGASTVSVTVTDSTTGRRPSRFEWSVVTAPTVPLAGRPERLRSARRPT